MSLKLNPVDRITLVHLENLPAIHQHFSCLLFFKHPTEQKALYRFTVSFFFTSLPLK